jgi:hypothetical protein
MTMRHQVAKPTLANMDTALTAHSGRGAYKEDGLIGAPADTVEELAAQCGWLIVGPPIKP